MVKTEPLLGEKFSKWEVIDIIPIYRGDQRYFKVKCECDITNTVHWSSLRLGKTKQCKSCFRKERQGLLKEGDTFKEYTVIDSTPIINNSASYWKVKCSCGDESYILYSHLLNTKRWFKCKKCANKENNKNYAIKLGQIGNIRISFINRFKAKAEERGIMFDDNITCKYVNYLWIKQKGKCALSGEDLVLDPGINNEGFNNVSIDRKDSSLSYTCTNIQLVTKNINISKHILSNQQFIQMCRDVVNHANQQPSYTNLNLCSIEGSETNG